MMKPLASASIAQVHRAAVLGKWLAVYLGDPPPRADGSGGPEYLHPVTRARDAQKLGKQRLAAISNDNEIPSSHA